MQQRTLFFWSAIFGNTLDHYDVAIYAFLAPIIAPVFFKQSDPTVALILTYSVGSFGLITRPLGAVLFGRMAIRHGSRKTLLVILLGMLATTLAMALIPGYASIGLVAAPILVTLVRTSQALFAAGEVSVASLFMLEQTDHKSLGRVSSYYAVTTMLGIGLASLMAAWVGSHPAHPWRYAFYASVLATAPVLGLRLAARDVPINLQQKTRSFKLILANKYQLLRIIIVSSFSYVTYTVPFVFMNVLMPLLSSISNVQMLSYTSLLSVLDVVLICLFGFLVDKFAYHRWMALMALLLASTIVPLFYYLPKASLLEVTLIRIWIVILGVAFAVPLNAWFFNLIKGSEKYLMTGLGYALGTELLGRNTTVVCLALFYYFHSSLAPAFYIMAVSVAASLALLLPPSRQEQC